MLIKIKDFLLNLFSNRVFLILFSLVSVFLLFFVVQCTRTVHASTLDSIIEAEAIDVGEPEDVKEGEVKKKLKKEKEPKKKRMTRKQKKAEAQRIWEEQLRRMTPEQRQIYMMKLQEQQMRQMREMQAMQMYQMMQRAW